MKKHLSLFTLSIAISTIVVVLFGGQFAGRAHAQSTSASMSGWTWSSNIGWGSASSTQLNAGGGGPYGLTVDGSGNITGYIWSSNIGWIQFGGLSSFPSNGTPSQNANVNLTTGAVTGWARACGGTVSGNCSSMTSRTDGWDGWIELSGANHESGSGGVALNPSTNVFSGYAWGSDVVGWVDMSGIVLCSSGTCGIPVTTNTLNVYTAGSGSGTVAGSDGVINNCSTKSGASSGTCTETVATPVSVTLTATPSSGSTFTGWSGACTNTTGTCVVNISGTVGVTATFTNGSGPSVLSCTIPALSNNVLNLSGAATASGGTGHYTYLWRVGAINGFLSQTSYTLSSGTYAISVEAVDSLNATSAPYPCGSVTVAGNPTTILFPVLWPGQAVPTTGVNFSQDPNTFVTIANPPAPVRTVHPGSNVTVSYAYPSGLTGCNSTITLPNGVNTLTSNPDLDTTLNSASSGSTQLQNLVQGVYAVQYSCQKPSVTYTNSNPIMAALHNLFAVNPTQTVLSNIIEIDVVSSTIHEK